MVVNRNITECFEMMLIFLGGIANHSHIARRERKGAVPEMQTTKNARTQAVIRKLRLTELGLLSKMPHPSKSGLGQTYLATFKSRKILEI